MKATAITIRPLRPEDDRSRFRSGSAPLDVYLSQYAGQNQFRHHIAVTYVAVAECAIVGYATLSAGQAEPARLPTPEKRRLPRYPAPVLRLARLAVATSDRGTGVGAMLLKLVCEMAVDLMDRVGCIGVVVDSKPEAVSFYERHSFRRLEPVATLGPPRYVELLLPIGTILAARP